MKINFFNLIIEILTLLSIVFALAVITSTNPVIAISFLIALFLTVAFYLILMGLTFIGLSYLLVYIGAITVLVLFIVMMISTDILQTVEVGPDYSKLLPLAYSLAILFLALFLITIPSFIIDFSSFEIYNLINNFVLVIFNKNTYSLNITDYSIFSSLFYYLNKLGLGFLLPETHNITNESLLAAEDYSGYSNKGTFYYYPWFQREYLVEFNPTTYSLIGSGNNPSGFYYWHPSKIEAVKNGLDFYGYTNSKPFSFPLGWYSDDPYVLFTEWTSNKNINLLLWKDLKFNNFFTHWENSWTLGYNFYARLPNNFVEHLFLPFSWSNYGEAQSAPWFTMTNPEFIWKTSYFPNDGLSLHNYNLNLTWLNISKYPEFLVEFPYSPVYSPNYFIGTTNSFGEVYHTIDLLNNTTGDFLLNKVEPVTLLHKNLQIQTLGQSIYGRYALLLILSSFLLLLAMVSPILLTRTAKN